MKSAASLRERCISWSHPARGAWIEIWRLLGCGAMKPSHPARGAWIEIRRLFAGEVHLVVAPRKGCVD